MKIIQFILLCFLFAQCCFAQHSNKISVADAKTDINELLATIKSVHYNAFHKMEEHKIHEIKDSIYSSWVSDSLSYRDFTKTGMQLASLMSNGHTSFDWQNPLLFAQLKSSVFLPVKVKMSKNGLVVTSSLSPLLKEGDVIFKINDLKAVTLFNDVMGLTGGLASFKEAVSEKLFPLYLFFFVIENDVFTIRMDTGEERYITGINVQELFEFIQSEIKAKNYTFEIIEENIGLLSYNKCEDYDAFSKFLDSTFQEISFHGINKLIIDLRYNSGGNSSLNDRLLSYLTQKKYRQSSGRYWKVSKEVKNKIENDSLWVDLFDSSFLSEYLESGNQGKLNKIDSSLTENPIPLNYFKGKHCFLIGPFTFSSANFLADAIKTFSLSTLIGESTGELTNDFGEQVEFQLTNSKSYFFVPTTYDIGASKNDSIMTPVMPDIVSEDNSLETAIIYLTEKKTNND